MEGFLLLGKAKFGASPNIICSDDYAVKKHFHFPHALVDTHTQLCP